MNHFFDTKEQYLLFRKIWARAVKSPRAKSYLIPSDECIRRSNYRCGLSRNTGVVRRKGWITPSHMILYNIIRNKPIDNGFTDVTNLYKIANSELWYDNAFATALEQLKIYQNYAKEFLVDPTSFRENCKYQLKLLNSFFEPFGTILSYQAFAELEVPTYNSLERKKGIKLEAKGDALKTIKVWRIKHVRGVAA